MRKRALNIQEVKQNISDLKGKKLLLAVNRGRNKITKYSGEIVDIFPSVFTFRAAAGELVSFAYSDIICGDIKIGYSGKQ